MSKDPNYPAMKWHPQTAENRVFQKAGDVPEGWLDTHPANVDNVSKQEVEVTPPAVLKAPLDMTRKEIVAALTEGGITFDPASKVVVLYELLTAEVNRVLTEEGIEYDPTAGTKKLLEILPKPE